MIIERINKLKFLLTNISYIFSKYGYHGYLFENPQEMFYSNQDILQKQYGDTYLNTFNGAFCF